MDVILAGSAISFSLSSVALMEWMLLTASQCAKVAMFVASQTHRGCLALFGVLTAHSRIHERNAVFGPIGEGLPMCRLAFLVADATVEYRG